MKTMLLVIVCGASAACSPPPRAPGVLASDFCAAVYRGDMRAADEAASEVTAPLDPKMQGSVTPRLADWLRSLPCVEKVEVSGDIIDTYPGIQEVAFVLRAKDGDRPRTCDADIHLAAPWRVGVHSSEWVSSNPDKRCTPLGGQPQPR